MFRNTKKRSSQGGDSSGAGRAILLADSSDDESNGNDDNNKDLGGQTHSEVHNSKNDLVSNVDKDRMNIIIPLAATKTKFRKKIPRNKKVGQGITGSVKLSFKDKEEEDESDSNGDYGSFVDSKYRASKSENVKRRNKHERGTSNTNKGFGFGGGSNIDTTNTIDDSYSEANKVDLPNKSSSSSSRANYDVESLKRMVSEQQQRQPLPASNPAMDPSDENNYSHSFVINESVDVDDDLNRGRQEEIISTKPNESSTLEEYIPLDRTGNNGATKFGSIDSMRFDDEEVSSVKQVEMMILTGEDAIALHDENKKRQASNVSADSFEIAIEAGNHVTGSNLSTLKLNSDSDQDMVDNNNDNDDWEAEVSRRAGVRVMPSYGKYSLPTSRNDKNESNMGRYKRSPLNEIRAAIITSIDDLESERVGLESVTVRRTYDVKQAKMEVEKHENELKQHGTALDFYQNWRSRMVSWVGAIREIQEKVKVLLSSLHTLEADRIALDRWQDWENDIIAVLYQHKLLNRVVGRQPPDIIYHDVITTIDEFGRDVKSQHVLQREHRRRKYQKILRNRTQKQYSMNESNEYSMSMKEDVFGMQSDGFVSDDEEDTFRTRHDALMKALAVAVDGIDEEYTVLHNLFALFEEWYKVYPDEYNQCYANLSLADLASILIQFELCSMNDPWDESGGYHEGRWMTSVRAAYDNGIINDASIERIFDRSVIPSIVDIFDKNAFNIASRKQMKAYHNFIRRIEKTFPSTKISIMAKLQPHMLRYLEDQLETIAIPILTIISIEGTRPTTIERIWKQNDVESDEVQDAIIGSTDVQSRRLNKILLNLLTYWAPLWQQQVQEQTKDQTLDINDVDKTTGSLSFVECVIKFIMDKYLVLLSSIRSIQRHRQMQRDLEHQSITPTGDAALDELTSTNSTALLESFGSSESLFRDLVEALIAMGWVDDSHHPDLVASLRAAGAAL